MEHTARARVSAALFRRPWLRAGLLLSPPGAWFVLIYLAALFLLFLSALWSVDSFSGKIVHSWTLSNFETLINTPVYRTIALRTIGIALLYPAFGFLVDRSLPLSLALLGAVGLAVAWLAAAPRHAFELDAAPPRPSGVPAP